MTLPATVVLLIHALAVARVTGLITADTITEPVRDRVISWLDDRPATLGSAVITLITCPWCAGFWVSAVAAPLAWLWGDHPVMLIPALALALSQITGMIHATGR